MTIPTGDVLVNEGTGTAVRTTTIGGVEYQVVVEADSSGHMIGSRPGYTASYTAATNAASREVAELFNASATAIVRVRGIWIIPTATSITGVQIGFDINKISAVGTTGSTVITIRKLDTNLPALDAGITARFGSTAGATLNHLWWQHYHFNDEAQDLQTVSLVNQLPVQGDRVVELVLRQNEGVQVKQSVTATVGLTGALIYFVTD
jgi:hypothetical protein